VYTYTVQCVGVVLHMDCCYVYIYTVPERDYCVIRPGGVTKISVAG